MPKNCISGITTRTPNSECNKLQEIAGAAGSTPLMLEFTSTCSCNGSASSIINQAQIPCDKVHHASPCSSSIPSDLSSMLFCTKRTHIPPTVCIYRYMLVQCICKHTHTQLYLYIVYVCAHTHTFHAIAQISSNIIKYPKASSSYRHGTGTWYFPPPAPLYMCMKAS